MIRLAIAEDQPLSMKALQQKLNGCDEIEVVYWAQNGRDLINFLEDDQAVDIILMDIEMPVMNGIDATALIANKYPQIKIIMFTVFEDEDHIFLSIKSGASGYILKEVSAGKLREMITDTMDGGAAMTPSIALKALHFLRNETLQPKVIPQVHLSKREVEILKHLTNGLSNKIIAEMLFISAFTVKRHVENIYQKLHAKNRISLIHNARNEGFIE